MRAPVSKKADPVQFWMLMLMVGYSFSRAVSSNQARTLTLIACDDVILSDGIH